MIYLWPVNPHIICKFECKTLRMKGTHQKLFWAIIGIIFLLNSLQAAFTELIYDEAYYWYFAQKLDWGYFDHPPMVAGLIALGGLVFKGTLGVRIMGVILSVATYVLLWETISLRHKKNYVIPFFVLVFSMTLLNAYGFFSLPDTPLLFFTALMFFILKHFFKKPNVGLSIALGLVMAALMYSKYHAVLVIVGVLIGMPSLLKNKYAWGALGVSILAYIPHFYWLYKQEFVSIAYHLFERPNRAYDFLDFGLGYFVNLLAIFGLTFPFIYKALFSVKTNTPLKKSMVGVVLTVLVFFFISSFNRRIQTQWIVVICIPIAILVFEQLIKNKRLRKQLLVSGILNIGLILFLRLGLVYEPLLPIAYEAHGNKAWTAALKEKVGDAMVVFKDSYRNAPMYAFYTGAKTYSLNSIRYRQNQYNIDGSEKVFLNNKVAYITKENNQSDFSFLKTDKVRYYGKWISEFKAYGRLKTKVIGVENGLITFGLQNPYPFKVSLKALHFSIAFLNSYKQYQYHSPIRLKNPPNPAKNITIEPNTFITLKGWYERPKDIKALKYFKLTIAPANLPFLLGGDNEKLDQWNHF